ncbi:mitochondrial ribosomal protein subunit L20-domain-containing protein [Mycena floridula]|nr:mitochondrial ribosomal protein subunit L20-domain-containing protein [Mycena floridula]
MNRHLALTFCRTYATRKWPRPRPGSSERPPYRAPDPLIDNPNATVTALPDEDLVFIHRPPPTAPSPLSLTTNPISPLLRPRVSPAGSPLPPHIRPSAASKEPPERASDETIAKIRKLRLEDPMKYSRSTLAKMFGCTPNFVALVASLPKTKRKAMRKAQDQKHDEIREAWSEKKTLVRAIRAKRKEYW